MLIIPGVDHEWHKSQTEATKIVIHCASARVYIGYIILVCKVIREKAPTIKDVSWNYSRDSFEGYKPNHDAIHSALSFSSVHI